jgi:hypothetical protein
MIGEKWMPAEDKLLSELSAGGVKYAVIAETLGRSVGSIRNRLSRLRNGSGAKPYRVVIKMGQAEYYALATAAEEVKKISEKLKQEERRNEAIFADYLRLYNLCRNLLKDYKNHRNMKTGYTKLEDELTERFPCPY